MGIVIEVDVNVAGFGPVLSQLSREEVAECRGSVLELQHVRDVTAALHRKHEVLRHLRAPQVAAAWLCQAVERSIDLNRAESTTEVRKFRFRGNAGWIERAVPILVLPPAGADQNAAVLFAHFGQKKGQRVQDMKPASSAPD